MKAKIALLSTATIGLILNAVPARAQSQGTAAAPGSDASAAGGGLEEVIVTARKRQESILKTPVQVTAIGATQIQEFQAEDLRAIETQVPDLLIGSTIGATGNQISLRGVTTSSLNAGIDQSISLNLDGLQLSQGLAYKSGLFDVAQVEVLKGPQALFYGKASPGGVISMHSNDPTDAVELIARGAYEFEAAQKQGELIASGPVTDTLKIRLAARIAGEDGYFTNTAVGDPAFGGASPRVRGLPDTDEYFVRGTVLWQPIDQLEIKLKANYTESDTDGTGGELQLSSCPNGVKDQISALGAFFPFPLASPQFLNNDCSADRNLAFTAMSPAAFPGLPNGGQQFLDITQIFGTLEANYHIMDGLTLTSVTGYYNMHENDVGNDSENALAGPIIAAYEAFHRRDFTEELRLASDFTGPFNFTSGAFIQDSTEFNSNAAYVNSVLGALPPFSFVPTGPNETLIHGFERMNIFSQSVFGQLMYKVLPDVEFSAGARWTHEVRTYAQIDYLLGPAYIPTLVPVLSSYHLNPEFSLTYTPTDNLTLYASYKEASKSGSYNISQPTLPGPNGPQDASFRDEGVKGEEFGIKGRLFDRDLRFNLDGYHYDYSNLQVGEAIVTAQGVVSETLNAASSEIYGIDLDGDYLVSQVEGLTLHGNLNWNHARFESFPSAPCWGGQTIAEGCNQGFVPGLSPGAFAPATGAYTAQNLAGKPLLRAPDWSLSFGFDYAMPLFNDWTLDIGSNTLYTSAYYTDLAFRSDMQQTAYFKTNLSLNLNSPGGDWEFSLIGNDLNDEITTSNCVSGPYSNGLFFGGWKGTTTAGPLGQDQLACNFDPGREVWLRVTYKFTR